MIFSPLALFGVFLGGDVFVFSAMATKVKVTKTMLSTLDYQSRDTDRDNAAGTQHNLSALWPGWFSQAIH